MLVPRGGKYLLPVGLLAGVLLLQQDAGGAVQLPVTPALKQAARLLELSSGDFLDSALEEVLLALGDLENTSLFVKGMGSGSGFNAPAASAPKIKPARRLFQLKTGLFVLHNRHMVRRTLQLLQAARAELNLDIPNQFGTTLRAEIAALDHVDAAIRDVKEFLKLPFIL